MQNLEKLVAHEGFPASGTVWEKHGKTRVYYRTPRGVKLYSDYDDGWSVKCFIDECGQHPNWYQSQRQQYIESIEEAHKILVGLDYIDDPAVGYSPETNAELNAAAVQARTILTATEEC